MEPQMLLRKAFHKTRAFFHKKLQSLRSLVFGGYKKLHKNSPLHQGKSNENMQQLEQLYRSLSRRWHSDNYRLRKSKKMEEEDLENCNESFIKDEEEIPLEEKHEEEGEEKEDKKVGIYREAKKGKATTGGSFVLAEKMKELEMMDTSDMDQVLDIEEVLHYYSRLSCPVYLDIVDEFFMDMYSEFFLPQPSTRISNSPRRLGPLNLKL